MRKNLLFVLCVFFISVFSAVAEASHRVSQFSNASVNVWKTVIYPNARQALPMHRHDHDRVLVALTDGELKITNNHGKVHYVHLKKDTAYFFKRDVPNELHNDENISSWPIKVMVIELKN